MLPGVRKTGAPRARDTDVPGIPTCPGDPPAREYHGDPGHRTPEPCSRFRHTPLPRHPSGSLVDVLHACTLTVDLRIPASHSLKEKRSVVRRLVDGARSRFEVAAAEVGYQDQWQRCELGFAAVLGTPGLVESVLDAVERFVWSEPEVEVVTCERAWLETGT